MVKRRRGSGLRMEDGWKPLFRAVDASRLRRAKTMLKQGAVSRIEVREGYIEAIVKAGGPGQQSHQVKLPCINWWPPRLDEIAARFSRHANWMAGLFVGEWEDDLLDWAEQSGLSLYPDEASIARVWRESSCDCNDPVVPCRHVLTVLWKVASELEECPFQALRYVGVGTEILDLIQAHTAKMVELHQATVASPFRTEGRPERAYSTALWPEEQSVGMEDAETDARQTQDLGVDWACPVFDEKKLQEWKKRYLG